jgi:hypothetical protein
MQGVGLMRHRQRGVTFIGWLFLLIPVGVLIYAGIRLLPVYLEYMSIARTLEQVKKEYEGNAPTATYIRNSIEKRFDVEDVKTIGAKDVAIKPQGRITVVSVDYDGWAPLFANIAIVVSFQKSVDISQ